MQALMGQMRHDAAISNVNYCSVWLLGAVLTVLVPQLLSVAHAGPWLQDKQLEQ